MLGWNFCSTTRLRRYAPSGRDEYYSTVALSDFRRIFTYPDPYSLAVFQSVGGRVFNKFIIHSDTFLWSYSLDTVARVTLGQADPKTLIATGEKIAGVESNVVFVKHVDIGGRALRK
jgi:hypothetical protein